MTPQPLTEAGKAVEELLPFHATGALSPAERRQVEAALAIDPELRRRLAIVEEEMTETALLNEGLGGPSTHALDRLMAAIDAEPKRATALGLGERVLGWLQSLTPRQAGFALAAAAMVFALQAGALVGLMVGRQGASFETASHGAPATAPTGAAFTVIFQPDARASDIAALMERTGARIVDGPRAGGIYRVVVGTAPLGKPEADALAARLRAEAGLVRLAAPAGN